MKEENDNLKDEILLLKDQVKELTRQKIEASNKERSRNDNGQDAIIKSLKEDKERMRTDNNNLAKELTTYKPVEGFACTRPYDRDNGENMRTSCTSVQGTPSSFDDIRRNPVTSSRFKKKQTCVSSCYVD